MRHPRTLILVVLFALGGAGGFVFARRDRNPTPSAASPEAGSIASKNADASSPTASAKLARRIAAALAEIEGAATGETLQAMWESYGPDTYGEACRSLLLARWAEVDPDGGFVYFQSRHDEPNLGKFCFEWALRDATTVGKKLASEKAWSVQAALDQSLPSVAPERYLEFVAALSKSVGRPAGGFHMDVAFEALGAADPEKALTLAETLTGVTRRRAFAGIAIAMAKVDPASARQWADGIMEGKDREAVLGGIALVIGRTNPEAAAGMLKGMADPFDWNGSGNTLLRELCGKDPTAAISWIQENFETYAKSDEWVSTVLVQLLWSAKEGDVIAAIGNTNDDALRDSLIHGLNNYTNWRNIGEMLATADGLGSAETREDIRSSVLRPKAQFDSAGALRYLESLPEGEATPALWESFVRGAASFEDLSGFGWGAIAKIPLERQGIFMGHWLRQTAESDPGSAIEKLESLREHPAYPQLAANVAGSLAHREPNEAMKWIESLEASVIPTAVHEFAGRIPSASAPQAFAWLQSLPISESTQSGAASQIASNWIANDGIAASAFIRDLPPGQARQGAIRGLIETTYRIDSEAALSWIAEIDEPEMREKYRADLVSFQEMDGRRTSP